MKKICLITHTEAQHTVQEKVGGWYDAPLTSKGENKARQLVDTVTAAGFDLHKTPIFASDLKRAAQTAEILIEGTGNTVITDPRLREMSYGSHGGINQAEHMLKMKPVSETGSQLDHRICEGAESRRDVAKRITGFVEEQMKEDGDLVVVTHGFAATFVIAAFQKVDIESVGYMAFKLKPGSVVLLEEDVLFKSRCVEFICT